MTAGGGLHVTAVFIVARGAGIDRVTMRGYPERSLSLGRMAISHLDPMIETRRGEWRLLCAPEHLELAHSVAARIPPILDSTEVFRDDYRSFVGLIEVEGRRVVVKSPRLKNRSRWIRWTTLFRRGEAVDTIANLWRARSHGAPVADPVFAMEKRVAGKVVDSWMAYFYMDGRRCEPSNYPALVNALQHLHELGWVHGDPHFDNFVWDGERVWILDCRPHRPTFGAISRAYDFVLLRNSRPELGALFGERTRSLGFRSAVAYDRWIHSWRAWKKKVRAALGKPRDTAHAEPLHRD